MQKERTIIDFEIIWKKINHKLTKGEETLLSQWLGEDIAHQRYLDKAIRYYNEGSEFTGNKTESEKVWKELNLKESEKGKNKTKWIVSIAAAVIVILMIANWLIPNNRVENTQLAVKQAEQIKPGSNKAILILDNGSVHDLTSSGNLDLKEGGSEIKSEGTKLLYTENKNLKKEIKYNTLSIPRGGEFFLQLADGTKVWLNSESVLRYPVQFIGNERRVELTGEAYFEVTRNEKVPFLVESGEQTVKVLGTQFNISSYTENPIIYTTLVKGSVEVFAKNKPQLKQILVPNEQTAINKADDQISKRVVDTYKYVAWKDGRFVFDDQTLGEIMNTLSKWYDVDVTFASNELRNFRFTGDLQRYSDFGEVLRKIGKTNEVKFIVENNKITIR